MDFSPIIGLLVLFTDGLAVCLNVVEWMLNLNRLGNLGKVGKGVGKRERERVREEEEREIETGWLTDWTEPLNLEINFADYPLFSLLC